jgi:hypothetical protein
LLEQSEGYQPDALPRGTVLACKFLLCNAPVMERMWCEEFAEVTLFIRHIKCIISGWVAYVTNATEVNESAQFI